MREIKSHNFYKQEQIMKWKIQKKKEKEREKPFMKFNCYITEQVMKVTLSITLKSHQDIETNIQILANSIENVML